MCVETGVADKGPDIISGHFSDFLLSAVALILYVALVTLKLQRKR